MRGVSAGPLILVLLGACGGSNGGGGADAAVPPPPSLVCDDPAPPVDVSSPDAVVGDGTPQSCTEEALTAAVAGGGVIVFDCGGAQTITVTSELQVGSDTVIDGGGSITLDGGGKSRILSVPSSFEKDTPRLTVQRLTFTGGKSPATGDDTDQGGGAIHLRGGSLTVIDSVFLDNQAPASGQDVAGGAIYTVGGGTTTISGSRFSGNHASNGGAVGILHTQLTVVNTVLTGNQATGSGGNPGNGGNGGAIYIDGVDQDIALCGVEITDNQGNAFGGGLFRVSNNGVGTHLIDRSLIRGNKIPDQSPSKAGGLYLQGAAIEIRDSTIADNQARSDGGLFAGPNSTLAMTNTTVAGNTALSSLAGGMSIADGVTGTILNCTFAGNRAPGDVAFAAATVGGQAVTLKNTVFAGQEVGNGYNPITCRDPMIDGGGNLQFPVARSGGGSDDPDALCASGAMVADAQLGALADNGGPTPTAMPAAGSPAIGLGSGCPAADQRGEPRADPCTSGAVEAP